MSADASGARRAVSGALGALSAGIAYVAATVYEQIVAGPSDPFLIVRDIHFGYYHRAVLAAWIGGACALVAFHVLDREERVSSAERWITRGTVPLVLVLGCLAVVFP